MLVSHRKQFIFIKTAKTAGTSVEVYFEKHCFPAGQWRYSHARPEYASATGIVGLRGPRPANAKYWNHMTSEEVRQAVGEAVWCQYFKFTVVRNPFDRLASAFFHWETKNNPSQGTLDNQTTVQRFRYWLKSQPHHFNPSACLIDGQFAVDYVIRFESLLAGIESVCQQIEVPFQPSEIRRLKSEHRNRSLSLADLYDRETIELVRRQYEFDLKHLGYQAPSLTAA